MKLCLLPILVLLSARISFAQALTVPSSVPDGVKEAVEQYGKMDADGRWLGPYPLVGVNKYFGDDRSKVPFTYKIVVVSRYAVGSIRNDSGRYYAIVNYLEFGSIDWTLHFEWGAGHQAVWGKAVPETTSMWVEPVRDPPNSAEGARHAERPPWRIEVSPTRFISVDTAMRYVIRMRDASNDPLKKYNAERTLAILNSLKAGALPPEPAKGPAAESPLQVAKRIVTLESSGTGFSPAGLAKLGPDFAEPPKLQSDTIFVVDVIVTVEYTVDDYSHAEVRTDSLGRLNSALRLTQYPVARPVPEGASACIGDFRFAFDLQLLDRRWAFSEEGEAKELVGPWAWRVSGGIPPLLGLDSAIRYVASMRSRTTDPKVRQNADRSLEILKLYKKGRLLPDKLMSPEPGAC